MTTDINWWVQASTIAQGILGVGLFTLGIATFVTDYLVRRTRRRGAVSALWAEYWRLNSVADRWAQVPLISWARGGALDLSEVTPIDWGVIIQLLAEVGPATAALGGAAYDSLGSAREHTRALIAGVPEGKISQATAEETEKTIRAYLSDAAMCLGDALRNAPRGLQDHSLTIANPLSNAGRTLQRAFRKQLLSDVQRWEPRLELLGRWIAIPFVAIARYFDPASVYGSDPNP